ncbi:suppressor of fused domain protein [Streptomyces vinaceus]|uniref:suppressor of fused domain protein n=1 Tax=Streptomyces vinaceus TaxID=1960 RepID=UPI0037F83163
MIDESARLHALEQHVRSFWDGHIVESSQWEHGPVLERVPHFTIYQVFPQRAGEAWVYVTSGSSTNRSEGEGTEFFLMSPVASEVHCETLAMVSHYHSFDSHELSVGSTINIGRPWMPGSRMDHLLVSLPYPYGPTLEWAPPEAGGARFLWLLPIHRSEADFIKRNTVDSFESILDARAVNILDADRDPLV